MASRFEIRIDGTSLVGESAGFGMPVIFLHAELTDRRMWAGQIEAVAAAGFHVVAYDRRGFGESEVAEGAFSDLDDLEALLDRLSINAAILVGSSAGGGLAIDFAIENPDRTVGLVLVGTTVSGADEPEFPEALEELLDARSYAAERRQWPSVNRLDAQLWLDGPTSKAGRVDGEPRRLFLEMNGDRLARGPVTPPEELQPAIDNLAGLSSPVLLIAGELDFPHVHELQDDLEGELENGFAVTLEETAHFPNLERPDLFDPVLLEFLEALAGTGEDEDN